MEAVAGRNLQRTAARRGWLLALCAAALCSGAGGCVELDRREVSLAEDAAPTRRPPLRDRMHPAESF